jgi:hypothetical protein
MSPFVDAARDFVATVPTPTAVATLRMRVRRRRRKRTLLTIAVVAAVSSASIGAAASLSHDATSPSVAVSPTTTRPNVWCVSTSRATAIAAVVRITTMVSSGDTEHAKLMTMRELRARETASTRSIADPPLADGRQVWVVEALGTVTQLFESGPTKFAWGLFEMGANGEGLLRSSAGPGATPSYWDALPDHSTECPTDNTRPAEPFTPPQPPPGDVCSPGQKPTFSAWDHGTFRPVQVNRAYWCRRSAELQPPAASHLSGSMDITNGKVTVVYYRATYKLLPSPRPKDHGRLILTEVTSTDPVPVGQLPPSIQKALKEP